MLRRLTLASLLVNRAVVCTSAAATRPLGTLHKQREDVCTSSSPESHLKQTSTEEIIAHSSDLSQDDDDEFEDYVQKRRKWTEEECATVVNTHLPCEKWADHLALASVRLLNAAWKLPVTLGIRRLDMDMWLTRLIFLETVAGVPGMLFATMRHLRSLRLMRHDGGWIHSMFGEAENERMHLLTIMHMKDAGTAFKMTVRLAQGFFGSYLFAAYMISPRYAHGFHGYLEENAVHTYSLLLEEIDAGKLPEFEKTASKMAIKYWGLKEDATWRQVFNHIRMDESNHRDVNHDLARLNPDAKNPHRNEWV